MSWLAIQLMFLSCKSRKLRDATHHNSHKIYATHTTEFVILNIRRRSIISLLSLLSDGENNDDCSVWREDRGMWWNVRLCGIRFYLFQEDFSDAERAAALQLPLKSHSITAPPTSTSTHFSSNSLKLYFLRPDRLFRDPGVIIKELLVKATQLLWLGQMTTISLVFSHKKCIVNIFHAMFMLHICHSFDSSMLSLPLHSAMPRICLQHRIWLQM